jgi:ABC-type lipoprotein release transport system permease subunit
MDKATLRAMLTGFGGGLVGAFIGGIIIFWLGFYDNQPIWVTVITLVGAAVGSAIGSGLNGDSKTT